ncbi:peptidylprolyl isomerase [Catalinimonas sp. 4WD22]|uniref:peptidylprolyl isomerase n=1 Tax=Catalinimonas locisalis TaxID=3133978 RepID=UPI003100B648
MKSLKIGVILPLSLLYFSISINAQSESSLARKKAALEKAEQIRKELIAGADFATLAKEHSDDPGSAVYGGELGFMGKGQLVPQYEKAALALATGETSEPVKTEFGYHIIQLLEIKEGRFNTRHILIKP